MANSELILGAREGGGRTPIKIGETTVTASQTVVSAVNALLASAGSKFTQALNENWNTLKININNTFVFHLNQCSQSTTIAFVYNVSNSSVIFESSILIDATGNNHTMNSWTINSTSATPTTYTNVSSAFTGTWELCV